MRIFRLFSTWKIGLIVKGKANLADVSPSDSYLRPALFFITYNFLEHRWSKSSFHPWKTVSVCEEGWLWEIVLDDRSGRFHFPLDYVPWPACCRISAKCSHALTISGSQHPLASYLVHRWFAGIISPIPLKPMAKALRSLLSINTCSNFFLKKHFLRKMRAFQKT